MSTPAGPTTGETPARLLEQGRIIKRADIIWEQKLWPRQGLDEDRVGEFADLYKDEPGSIPAIKVAEHPTQTGKYRAFDGWHRNAAQERLHWKEAPADIYGKETDIYVEAVRASAIGSKPLTRLEKRAAVRKLLDEHKDWSDRKIARMAGVSGVFVSSQHKKLVRVAGEAKDKVEKFFGPATDATSSSTSVSTPDAPSINQLLMNVLADSRVAQINIETWQVALEKFPHIKPMARHVATVLYQASQKPAPAAGTANVSTQTQLGRPLWTEKYQQPDSGGSPGRIGQITQGQKPTEGRK